MPWNYPCITYDSFIFEVSKISPQDSIRSKRKLLAPWTKNLVIADISYHLIAGTSDITKTHFTAWDSQSWLHSQSLHMMGIKHPYSKSHTFMPTTIEAQWPGGLIWGERVANFIKYIIESNRVHICHMNMLQLAPVKTLLFLLKK